MRPATLFLQAPVLDRTAARPPFEAVPSTRTLHILMMTNTYAPLVGGLERSVRDFTAAYRQRGHHAVVVAPVFRDMPAHEDGVIRIPAIRHFNGSDFSVKLPLPSQLTHALLQFRPDIVHAHHPFLIGNTALRLAHTHKVPLIFTHHTLFEQYTDYWPMRTPAGERFLIELSTGFANLCNLVFAPSHSVAELLRQRGVETPIEVVPTGVDVARFANGSRQRGRASLGVPPRAWLVGHVGRLASEKNLDLLQRALRIHVLAYPSAHAVIAGDGPLRSHLEQPLRNSPLATQVHFPGLLRDQALVDAYHAMDAFLITSKSETQGLVVTEAMAAGVPVIALDAPGICDVVRDGVNGRLVSSETAAALAAALRWLWELPADRREQLRESARQTAVQYSMDRCADRALELYRRVAAQRFTRRSSHQNRWATALRRVKAEWDVLKTVSKAAGAALTEPRAHP